MVPVRPAALAAAWVLVNKGEKPMKYTSNSSVVINEMLASMGLNDINQLFADIPEDILFKGDLQLGEGLSEMELRRRLKSLADKNISVEDFPCFLGAGAYDHFIPAALEQLLLRSEFYTAYTPYQPEISQGILQAIFEYQTMICSLTGMEVSNASLYDGGSALAEACLLACESSGKKRVLIAGTLHPEYLQIVQTYALSDRMEVVVVPEKDGIVDRQVLEDLLAEDCAALVMQQPNFYGILEDLSGLAAAVHQRKGLFIMSVDPISLAILKSPAEYGADVVVGEGQALGNPLSFGGPYLGFIATSARYMRKIPGRIVGQTTDGDGARAFVLTLQAREQHIRREKASSNICSNHALNALAATIYLSLIGPRGLRDIALRCSQAAIYARNKLAEKGVPLCYQQPFFREFAVKVEDPLQANYRLLEHGIIGGYELPEGMLLAFTEKRTRQEIDKLADILGGSK